MLYLIRHGETVWNTLGRFQGQKDSALTARGEAQADALGRLLARELASEDVLTCYVSPLGRARQTANVVGRHLRLDRIDEPRLTEVSLGSWDGLSRRQLEQEHAQALAGATRFDWYFRSPDGESVEAGQERVAAWLAEVRSPAVAVSHGLLGRLIRGIYLGLSRREMLELPVPQDGIFKLSGGAVRFLDGMLEKPAALPR